MRCLPNISQAGSTGGMRNESKGAIFDPARTENDSAAVDFKKACWGVGVEQSI
jgi:hypothetical protein